MIYHVGVADGEGAAVSFPDLSICEMSDFLFFFFPPLLLRKERQIINLAVLFNFGFERFFYQGWTFLRCVSFLGVDLP